MKLLLILSGISLVVAIVARTSVPSNPLLDSALVHLRAGKRDSSTSSRIDSSKPSRGRKKSKFSGKSDRKRSDSSRQRKKVPGIKDKFKKLVKQGQMVYNDVYRRAKVLRSSEFEAMLLKATWPSDEPVQPEILGEIIKYSIPTFKTIEEESEDSPYSMTLHKLWTKMYETDWRTVVKSLYILHTILRDCGSDDCSRFGAAIKDMARTRNPKSPDHKYFDLDKITELNEAGDAAGFSSFVTAYAKFVTFRAKNFNARFDELKKINTKSSEQKVLAVLKKAQQCLTLGLAAQVQDKPQANAISGYATKQVAADLRDLHTLYGKKIAPFAAGGRYAQPLAQGKNASIAEALKFYQDFEPKLKAYLSNQAKLFVRLRIKIPTDLDRKDIPTPEALAARIKDLSNLSGGAQDRNSGSSHSPSSISTSNNRQKKTLQRVNRPLTPEEAIAQVEQVSCFSANPTTSTSISTTFPFPIPATAHINRGLGACGAGGVGGPAGRVRELLQHSAGAKPPLASHSDDDEQDEDEEEEGEELEGDDEEEDDDVFVDDEEGINDDGDESLEVGLERSLAYKKPASGAGAGARAANKHSQDDEEEDEEEEDEDEGDEDVDEDDEDAEDQEEEGEEDSNGFDDKGEDNEDNEEEDEDVDENVDDEGGEDDIEEEGEEEEEQFDDESE